MAPLVAEMLGRVTRTLLAGSFMIVIFPFDQPTQTSPGAEPRSRGMEQIAATVVAADFPKLEFFVTTKVVEAAFSPKNA